MSVELRAPEADSLADFIQITTASYQPNYGDVDASMARHIVESHERGVDPFGYMTLRKEVLAVHVGGRLAGFTTLTWKRGGSVKTGPTLLFPEHRGRGIGPRVQLEIQRRVLSRGGRKTYGTVSDANQSAFRYMVKAGYDVETRLKDHYRSGVDEVVFGRVLKQGSFAAPPVPASTVPERGLRVFQAQAEDIRGRAAELIGLFDRFLVPADTVLTDNLAAAVSRDIRDFGKKPKRAVFAQLGSTLRGALIIAPKRGGSVKINCLGSLSPEAFLKAVSVVAPELESAGFRKLSLFAPTQLGALAAGLCGRGWISEGRLRQPYEPGNDVKVLSTFMRGRA